MQDEIGNNNFFIVVVLCVLFVVILLSFSVIFDFLGNLAEEGILNIVESLNVE